MTSGRSRLAMELVSGRSVARGAALGVAICLPLALVGQQVVDDREGSPLAALLFLAVLVGFAVAGYVAARAADAAPFTNGGLAALAAFLVIQGGALLVRAATGDPPSVPAVAFNAIVAFGCGLAGGALAGRRSNSQRRTT